MSASADDQCIFQCRSTILDGSSKELLLGLVNITLCLIARLLNVKLT